jgi:hypothetical protein
MNHIKKQAHITYFGSKGATPQHEAKRIKHGYPMQLAPEKDASM